LAENPPQEKKTDDAPAKKIADGNTADETVKTSEAAQIPATFEPPAFLAASPAGSRKIVLRWSAAPGTEKYRIYRSLNPWNSYKLCGESTLCNYTDEVPSPQTKYYYFVQSLRDTEKSKPSQMICATTLPALAQPEVPQGVAVQAIRANEIELRWEPAKAAAAYCIWCRADDTREFEIIDFTYDTTYIHTELDAGTRYEYRIQGYHDSGVSALSAIAMASTDENTPDASQPNRSYAAPTRSNRFSGFPNFSLQGFSRPNF
jgi:fibronectin type 3 domain-containing protein